VRYCPALAVTNVPSHFGSGSLSSCALFIRAVRASVDTVSVLLTAYITKKISSTCSVCFLNVRKSMKHFIIMS